MIDARPGKISDQNGPARPENHTPGFTTLVPTTSCFSFGTSKCETTRGNEKSGGGLKKRKKQFVNEQSPNEWHKFRGKYPAMIKNIPLR